VSGTPCKRDVSDLYGLLVFLRYQPIAGSPSLWARIRHDWDAFVRVFHPLVCRNTKRYVKDEMALPPQTKAVLSVDFTAVEEINYQHIFEQMLDDCGLTPAGTPAPTNVDLGDRVTEKMKKWLGTDMQVVRTNWTVRLRQACSHPGVGSWRSGTKEMKTMDEVLEKMYEDTCTAISRDERESFVTRIKRGQIYDANKEHDRALEEWKKVLEDVRERAVVKKKEVQELKRKVNSDADSESSSASDDEDLEDERRAKRQRAMRTKRANELRDLQDLQHRATFMMASANFQLKNEEEETRLYDEAEKLRREVRLRPTKSDPDSSPSNPKSKPLYQTAK
jgi:E3 ubiquitin-protein ligase SHPRH